MHARALRRCLKPRCCLTTTAMQWHRSNADCPCPLCRPDFDPFVYLNHFKREETEVTIGTRTRQRHLCSSSRNAWTPPLSRERNPQTRPATWAWLAGHIEHISDLSPALNNCERASGFWCSGIRYNSTSTGRVHQRSGKGQSSPVYKKYYCTGSIEYIYSRREIASSELVKVTVW
jgi:hypothetical protein